MTTDVLDTLIERELGPARDGDRAAYARLVAATQRMVASVAFAITRDLAVSEDIAQETFLTAWQRLGSMRNPQSFLPWLRQATRNRAIDHLRTLRYREATMDHREPRFEAASAAVPDPVESLGVAEDAAALAQALDEIPAEHREILLLFYREGQSSRAVATLLGISDGAVRKRLERARTTLRAEVLRNVDSAAVRTAPGGAFTAAVIAALAVQPGAAGAAGASALGASAALKTAPKLLGVLGSLLASIGLVVGAVLVEMRWYWQRARNPRQRRDLLHNGIVYGALMATYMLLLHWSATHDWSLAQTLGTALGVSIAVLLLALRRRRVLSKHEHE